MKSYLQCLLEGVIIGAVLLVFLNWYGLPYDLTRRLEALEKKTAWMDHTKPATNFQNTGGQ